MPNYEATIKVTIFGVKNEEEAHLVAKEVESQIPSRVFPAEHQLSFGIGVFEPPTVSIISN